MKAPDFKSRQFFAFQNSFVLFNSSTVDLQSLHLDCNQFWVEYFLLFIYWAWLQIASNRQLSHLRNLIVESGWSRIREFVIAMRKFSGV